jgi:DNA-binding NarL/FixJ family response regulator
VTVRVVLCNEEPLARAGLRALLTSVGDVDVIGEASSPIGTVAAARRLKPDVVLMDVSMLGVQALDVIRELAEPKNGEPIAVLVLATQVEDRYLVESLRVGARGLIHKGVQPEEVVCAIRMIAKGSAVLSPPATYRLRDLLRSLPAVKHPSPALAQLTSREREILVLIARGWTNARIAKELSLGMATVKSHVYHLRRKLNVEDRAQVVVFAYQNNLIPDC